MVGYDWVVGYHSEFAYHVVKILFVLVMPAIFFSFHQLMRCISFLLSLFLFLWIWSVLDQVIIVGGVTQRRKNETIFFCPEFHNLSKTEKMLEAFYNLSFFCNKGLTKKKMIILTKNIKRKKYFSNQVGIPD